MQRLPYTLNEANEVCKKLQYLIGHTFDLSEPGFGNVECIAVTPFDQINKKKFFLYYMLVGDAQLALTGEYKGLLFDICIIARSEYDCNDIKHYDIDTWLQKNNLEIDDLLNAPQIGGKMIVENDDDVLCN